MHQEEQNELTRRFQYHPPTTEQTRSDHENVRRIFRETAEQVKDILPASAGRELALSITKIEEAMMWANAGIARHSGSEGGQ
jgi:hypothetical protein